MQRRACLCRLVCSQGDQQNLVTRGKKEKVVSQSENDSLGEKGWQWHLTSNSLAGRPRVRVTLVHIPAVPLRSQGALDGYLKSKTKNQKNPLRNSVFPVVKCPPYRAVVRNNEITVWAELGTALGVKSTWRWAWSQYNMALGVKSV